MFAAVSNKTRHLNLLADWRAAATMKTSRDNRLRMKHLHLFIIEEKKKLPVETVKAVQQENTYRTKATMKTTRHRVPSQYLKPSEEIIHPYMNIQKIQVLGNFKKGKNSR